MEVLERRRSEEPDIEIITYDKILETQADQLSRIVLPDLDTRSRLSLNLAERRIFREGLLPDCRFVRSLDD